MAANKFQPTLLAVCLSLFLTIVSGAAHALLPIEHWTTPQGVRVYFVAAPSIPMLDVQIDFDAGSRYDPAGKVGLASIANALLGTAIASAAGNSALTEAQIAEAFANLGAQRGGSASDDRASVSLRTLTSLPEREAGLALLARLVGSPSFSQVVLNREKERIVQSIRESETKPESIASKTFNSLIYGNHPYGNEASIASVQSITTADLNAFFQQHYVRQNAVVSMVGAISRGEAEKIALALTALLPNAAIKSNGSSNDKAGARPALPAITKPSGIDRRIEHPATQSHILLGTTGVARGNPDYFPLLVANYTLGGGGFVSRLYNEVREKRGLVYSVYSYFVPQVQEGPFTIGLQTQREQTATALQVVNETLKKFVDDGPTDDELAAAKSNLMGGFALRIDNNRKILDNVAAVGYYRLPIDYLDGWTTQIQKVTRQEAHAAFRKYVDPNKLVTVVVGNASAAK